MTPIVIPDPYVHVRAVCPKCESDDCHVYIEDDGPSAADRQARYERLVCNTCFYEEWNQPPGTFKQLGQKMLTWRVNLT